MALGRYLDGAPQPSRVRGVKILGAVAVGLAVFWFCNRRGEPPVEQFGRFLSALEDLVT